MPPLAQALHAPFLESGEQARLTERKSKGKMCAEIGVGNGSLEVTTSALRHKQEKGRQRLKAYELEGITL